MAKTLILSVLLLASYAGVQLVHGQTRHNKFLDEFRALCDNGWLDAAEAALEDAQKDGLDQPTYQNCILELEERREQARQLIQSGDTLLRAEHYKEARLRYEQARKIYRDNTVVAGKIAMAERLEHEARARAVKETIGIVMPVATKVLSDYFDFKRAEEQRKRDEAARRRP